MIIRQLLALIDLRIKLSRNQQLKAGSLNFYLSRILFVLMSIGTIFSFFGTAVGGAFLFKVLTVQSCNSVWGIAVCLFLFYWMLMVFGQLQQTETISFEKLLHMPVSLRGAFLLNYFSSYANSAVWLGGPVLFGLSIGMGLAKGPQLWGLLPATIAIFLLVTALTYQLRGWVSRLMQNKRVKSFAMMLVPCLILVVFALLFFDRGKGDSSWKDGVTLELRSAFRAGPSSTLILSMIVVAVGSLFLSYRSIVHQYLGTTTFKSKKTARPTTHKNPDFMFLRMPLVSEESSAVTVAAIRNLTRSPEMLAALIPLIVLVFFGSPYLIGMDGYNISEVVRPWIPVGIITITMLGFPAFLFSMFSYDRDGFRAFVLSPMKRKDILIGKNLAIGLMTILAGALSLLIIQLAIPYDLTVFLASLLQLVVSYLFISVIGNFLSVVFPVGLKRGSMQPANAPVLTTILLYVGVLGGPLLVVLPATCAVGIAMLANGSFVVVDPWIFLGLTLIQLVVAMIVYFFSLRFFDVAFWENQPNIVNTVGNLPE